MTLRDLQELEARVKKAMAVAEKRAEKEALEELKVTAAKHGFSLDHFMRENLKGRKISPKYKHPENPSITWSGRGRKSKWIETHLERGGKLDDLAI